jgi:hypothetical protein
MHSGDAHNLAVLSKELPPEDEVQQRRYHYDPCPLNFPIPPQMFLHAMLSPECYRGSVLQERIPKKLSTMVSSSETVGWGMYIVQGPHWLAITVYVSASLILSVVLALLWALLRHGDVQGGFGIGSFVVGLISIATAAVFFKWSYR